MVEYEGRWEAGFGVTGFRASEGLQDFTLIAVLSLRMLRGLAP